MSLKSISLSSLTILIFASGAFAQVDSSQCIQSVCGDPIDLSDPFAKNPEQKEVARKEVMGHLGKPVQNYMGLVINQSLVRDKIFKSIFKNKANLTVNPSEQGFLQLIKYIQDLSRYLGALENLDSGVPQFNETKLKSIIGNPSADEIEAIRSLLPVVLFVMHEGGIFKMPMELWIKSYYPNLSFIEGAQLEAQKIMEVEAIVETVVPSLKHFWPYELLVRKALNRQPLTEMEKVRFSMLTREMKVKGLLLRSEILEKFKKLPLDLTSFLTDLEIKYQSSKMSQAFKNPKSIKSIFKSAVEICTEKLTYSQGALPTNQEMSEFRNHFEKIRTTAQQLIEERLGRNLENPLSVELVLPATKESLALNLKESLAQTNQSMKESATYLRKLDLNNIDTLNSVLTLAGTFSDKDLLTEVTEFCGEVTPAFLSDAALSASGIMSLSWVSIKNRDIGDGIIAHELGHIVSKKWGQEFSQDKACQTPALSKLFRLEEAFADYFSVLVNKKLHQSEKLLSNFACSFFNSKGQSWSSEKYENESDGDSHESPLRRLMMFALQTKGLTNQCADYLSKIGEKPPANSCK